MGMASLASAVACQALAAGTRDIPGSPGNLAVDMTWVAAPTMSRASLVWCVRGAPGADP